MLGAAAFRAGQPLCRDARDEGAAAQLTITTITITIITNADTITNTIAIAVMFTSLLGAAAQLLRRLREQLHRPRPNHNSRSTDALHITMHMILCCKTGR